MRETEQQIPAQYGRAHVHGNILVTPLFDGGPPPARVRDGNAGDSLLQSGIDQGGAEENRRNDVLHIWRAERDLPEQLAGGLVHADNILLRLRNHLTHAPWRGDHRRRVARTVALPGPLDLA